MEHNPPVVRSAPVFKPNGRAKALAAVICMSLITVVAILLIILFVPVQEDRVMLIGLITIAVGPTTVALLGYLKSSENQAQLQNLAVSVDGRLTDLLQETRRSERAIGELVGQKQGLQQGRAVAEEIAQALATPPPEPTDSTPNPTIGG